MSGPIKHFLIVFDHAEGRLVDLVEFGDDGKAAVAAYSAKEKELHGKDQIEIVLIGSDSLETVRTTHANYFDGTVAVSKYLRGIWAAGYISPDAQTVQGASQEHNGQPASR